MERLSDRELLELVAKRIEEMAWAIPSPNPHTPNFIMLSQAIAAEVARRNEQDGESVQEYDQITPGGDFLPVSPTPLSMR